MTRFEQIKLKEKWCKLNYEIAQIQKVIKQNTAAGQIFSEEYLQWVNEKIQLRDSLTDLIN
jgi:hypothetical protein